MSSKSPEEQLAVLQRGVACIYTEDDLLAKLRSAAEAARPLLVKLGLDPTAPDVHLGHGVVLRKARQFQDLGHKVIIIIGDFTARIGDPTGKSKTRPVPTSEQVTQNAATYLDQVGSILDSSPERLELRHNSEWLSALSFEQVLRLAGTTTVARMMERDTFEERWKAQEPIGFHEFFYPLMQGYDSVVIEADVELGGTDQTYNNLFGRDLQRSLGHEAQVVLTMPILRGLDGVKKMSKSLGNYIGVTEDANSIVQKLYGMADDLVPHYYELLTSEDMTRVQARLDGGEIMPLKRELAAVIAGTFHDEAAVAAALANLDSDVPLDMDEAMLAAEMRDADGTVSALDLLKCGGFPGSNRDLRARLIQGALRVDGVVVDDPTARVAANPGTTFSFGNAKKKTNWRRLRVE